jgi:glycosyltransferase involved in cell wall biosynthesis
LHAKWISNNPNTFDKLLVETNFAYEWALDQGWLPSRLETIAHTAHRIGFESIDVDQCKEVKGAIKILWYNRFASEKQPDLFIKLATIAQENRLPFEFLMGGSGPLRSEIETAVANLELLNLQLLDEEISNAGALKISDFLVMTSSSVEGRPLICSEALESGLDLILPNLPNFSDFVTDGFEGIHIYSDFEEIFTMLKSFDIEGHRDLKKQRANKNRNIASDRANLKHFLQTFIP